MLSTIELKDIHIPIYKGDLPNKLDDKAISIIIKKVTDPDFQFQLQPPTNQTSDDYIGLEYLSSGIFSHVFRLIINDEELILKIKNSQFGKGSINYIQEMIRMQILRQTLGETLQIYGVFIPKYYFSTFDIACREYINGVPVDLRSAGELVPQIEGVLSNFLNDQIAQNPGLWDDCYLDIHDKIGNPSGKNFIKTSDGRIYLIDPFTN